MRNILPLTLPPEYRCVPNFDHSWDLQYRDPAMLRWHTLSTRDTVAEIKADYEQLVDCGELPSSS